MDHLPGARAMHPAEMASEPMPAPWLNILHDLRTSALSVGLARLSAMLQHASATMTGPRTEPAKLAAFLAALAALAETQVFVSIRIVINQDVPVLLPANLLIRGGQSIFQGLDSDWVYYSTPSSLLLETS